MPAHQTPNKPHKAHDHVFVTFAGQGRKLSPEGSESFLVRAHVLCHLRTAISFSTLNNEIFFFFLLVVHHIHVLKCLLFASFLSLSSVAMCGRLLPGIELYGSGIERL